MPYMQILCSFDLSQLCVRERSILCPSYFKFHQCLEMFLETGNDAFLMRLERENCHAENDSFPCSGIVSLGYVCVFWVMTMSHRRPSGHEGWCPVPWERVVRGCGHLRESRYPHWTVINYSLRPRVPQNHMDLSLWVGVDERVPGDIFSILIQVTGIHIP